MVALGATALPSYPPRVPTSDSSPWRPFIDFMIRKAYYTVFFLLSYTTRGGVYLWGPGLYITEFKEAKYLLGEIVKLFPSALFNQNVLRIKSMVIKISFELGRFK